MALACPKVNLEFETDDLQTGSTTNTGTMLTCRGVSISVCRIPPSLGSHSLEPTTEDFPSQVEGI